MGGKGVSFLAPAFRRYETHLSTKQAHAQATVRFSRTDENQGWACPPQSATSAWSKMLASKGVEISTPGIPNPERLRFPRAARIHAGGEFALVRSEGRSVQGRFLRLSAARIRWRQTRFGFITPRRIGMAVIRNRVRRRLREICRLYRRVFRPWLAGRDRGEIACDQGYFLRNA